MLHHREMHAAQGQTEVPNPEPPWSSASITGWRWSFDLPKSSLNQNEIPRPLSCLTAAPEVDPGEEQWTRHTSLWSPGAAQHTDTVSLPAPRLGATSQIFSSSTLRISLWVCRAFTASQIISQGVGPVQHGHWGQCCLAGPSLQSLDSSTHLPASPATLFFPHSPSSLSRCLLFFSARPICVLFITFCFDLPFFPLLDITAHTALMSVLEGLEKKTRKKEKTSSNHPDWC